MNQVQVKCNRIVRVGSLGDGGWNICLDDGYYPTKPCLVYSFGIGGDSSFGVQMHKTFGCEVHSFDPFVKGPHRELSHYHAIGLGDKTGTYKGRKFMTLLDIRRHLNHMNKDICILKMDIEGSEWSSLKKAMSDGELDHVKQIPLEFHSPAKGAKFFRNALNTIKKLMDLNFRVYLVDRNNACRYKNDRNIQLTKCYNIYFIKVS
ncbi:probable methyltransferase-like protein 24 [Octopus bimaculoides]|nr:probable methyltransferase-like protein 24 [Octopus bimaculoides]|eukprot:XP_014782484.1 PREDICTED: methyltransferase-like protein 24 [Octopus bimaculoides]